MLKNFSSRALKTLLIPIWVIVGFMLSYLWVSLIVFLLKQFGLPIESANQTLVNATISAVVYVLSIVIVIGLPWLVKKSTTKEQLGLNRLVSWLDILITPAGAIVYLLLSVILLNVASNVLPWFDINQAQDIGFEGLVFRYEYVLAFVTLVVLAPIAEEILFRGYLYGKIKKYAPVWVAILITSLLFGFIHGAWNVGIDTFALSIILCLLREITGGLWAPIMLHMLKNGVAFYLLFINPVI